MHWRGAVPLNLDTNTCRSGSARATAVISNNECAPYSPRMMNSSRYVQDANAVNTSSFTVRYVNVTDRTCGKPCVKATTLSVLVPQFNSKWVALPFLWMMCGILEVRRITTLWSTLHAAIPSLSRSTGLRKKRRRVSVSREHEPVLSSLRQVHTRRLHSFKPA